MFSFAEYMDLPLVWAFLIGTAVFMYVLLDGFDLGVGILFPFAPSDDCRSKMMNSIAPFWDGNETWLILGGAGLLVVFPLAYATIMPALYFPILMMLISLIFRGVAFEFRFKAEGKNRRYWDYSFHFGSLIAAFSQGVILGGIVQGIKTFGREFTGSPFDWISAFTLTCGISVVAGYTLLGSTWLFMKTEGSTQKWAKNSVKYALTFVLIFLGIISLTLPFMREDIKELWFSYPNILMLAPVPILVILISYLLISTLKKGYEVTPFVCAVGIFFLSYLGLAIGIYPYAVPFEITIWEAAAAPETLSLALVAVGFMLPVVLGYTAYSYYVFRGKASEKPMY